MVTHGVMYDSSFGTVEACDFYLDGVKIGRWHCIKALQRKYGEFWPDDNFKANMPNGYHCFSGETYTVKAKIERAIKGW